MIYQSTVDAIELSDNLYNKKDPYGDVSIICHKMLSVVPFFNPQFLFLSLQISFRTSVAVLLFVE